MTDHVNLSDAELHEPKHIQTALGGDNDKGKVIKALGDGTSELARLSYSDLAENVAIVFVSEEADLPTPVGGVIDLGSGITYTFVQSFTLNSRLAYGPNTQLDGINSGTVIVDYNGVQPVLSNNTPDADLRADSFTLNAPNAALFNLTDAADSGSLRFESCSLTAASFGTLNNASIVQFNQTNLFLNTSGITFTGVVTNPTFNFINSQAFMDAGTFLDITGVVMRGARIEFAAVIENAAGVIAINSNGEADVVAGSLFTIRSASIGVTTPLAGGVNNRSRRWLFDSALPVQDTQLGVAAHVEILETVTITTAGVYESIGGGNWLSGAINDGLVVDANGITTYVGERPLAMQVTANVTAERVGGGAGTLAIRIAKNGTTLAYSQGQTENVNPTQMSSNAILELVTGDTFEVQVANLTTTADVDVVIANVVGVRVP